MRRRLPTSGCSQQGSRGTVVRLAGEDMSPLLAQYAGRFHLLPCVRWLFHFSWRHSLLCPGKYSTECLSQEAAEEVDVDEPKRIAKEAAEKARDEKEGEELRRQPKPRGEFGKASKSFNPTRGVIPGVGSFGNDVPEAKRRARCVDPLVEAISHMANIRLFGKFINNLNRYWGPNN